MLCPHCKDVRLSIADRQGIEIDYCPQCRGVWLDRGELDKLIEHRGQAAERPAPAPDRAPRDDPGYDPRRSRRKGFLSEIFDFD